MEEEREGDLGASSAETASGVCVSAVAGQRACIDARSRVVNSVSPLSPLFQTAADCCQSLHSPCPRFWRFELAGSCPVRVRDCNPPRSACMETASHAMPAPWARAGSFLHPLRQFFFSFFFCFAQLEQASPTSTAFSGSRGGMSLIAPLGSEQARITFRRQADAVSLSALDERMEHPATVMPPLMRCAFRSALLQPGVLLHASD